jgi:SAM-dependent methyltransferase
MKDLFGKALLDFYCNRFESPLLLHNEYGPPEEIPVESYFRGPDEYSDLEIFALGYVKGKILDVGAATGRHASYLQNKGFIVSAMDISGYCGELMHNLGVKDVMIRDIREFEGARYDTVTMLMNGIGLAGDICNLERLLVHLKKIVKPSGQVLLDSTDISYLYEGSALPSDKYYGELSFYYEYRGDTDQPFKWLYIDQDRLMQIADDCGWQCQVIFEDETDAYLARLTQK